MTHSRFIVRAFAWLCLVLMVVPTSANAGSKKENLVKVAFLYNFTKFVEWPQSSDNLNICVAASEGFVDASRAIEKRSNSRKTYSILVQPQQYDRCHMVFMEDSSIMSGAELSAAAPGKPMLTVGLGEEFAKNGGMISFVLIENKVKLIINLDAVQKSGLKISSQLLEVAHKVIQGN